MRCTLAPTVHPSRPILLAGIKRPQMASRGVSYCFPGLNSGKELDWNRRSAGFLAVLLGKQTIEDRFVPRDDGCFMAQGPGEGCQRKPVVFASPQPLKGPLRERTAGPVFAKEPKRLRQSRTLEMRSGVRVLDCRCHAYTRAWS